MIENIYFCENCRASVSESKVWRARDYIAVAYRFFCSLDCFLDWLDSKKS